MRIVHVSDIHIRNFKYREEYRAAFADLYRQLEELEPNLVINTGDTVHSKLAVSPELFDDVADHMLAVTEIAPYWLILGNHDLNLKNVARTDAISPIVRALQGRTDHELLLLTAGEHVLRDFYHRYRFWNYDIRSHGQFTVDGRFVNIGLYHGSISGCVTDMGFTMEEGEAELDKFVGMDFVMLGDIHKRQSFRDGRIRYPGSLIQQNYGEELIKGFLLWDIRGKDDFSVDFHPIAVPGRFYTIQVPASLEVPIADIPQGSRIKVIVDGEVSPSQRLQLEGKIRKEFSPIEVIVPDSSEGVRRGTLADVDSLVSSRESMMREYLTDRGHGDPDAVINSFNRLEATLDRDVSSRGTTWQLRRFEWDDMLNYGEGNFVDLTALRGLVGIFAPNASGKSSIFDILMQGLFDRISKDVPRNIDLVNDNRDSGRMRVFFQSNDREYFLERTIERIHYGQRKLAEAKQWGRTSLDLSRRDSPDAISESLNGTSRPETERNVREVIGSFEDFVLTSVVTQNPVFGLPGGADLINCKETDRRKILFRILDLDVYERVGALVREDLKRAMGRLKGERERLVADLDDASHRLGLLETEVRAKRDEIEVMEPELSAVKAQISSLKQTQSAIDELARARNRLSARQAAVAVAKTTLQKASDRLASIRESVAVLKSTRPDDPGGDLDVTSAQLRAVAGEVGALSRSLAEVQAEKKSGVQSLRILDEVPCGDSFPDCQFITGAYRFKMCLASLDQAIEGLLGQLNSKENAKRTLESKSEAQARFIAWQKRLTDASQAECDALEKVDEASASHSVALSEQVAAQEGVTRLQEALDSDSPIILQGLMDRRDALDTLLTGLRDALDSLLIRLGGARGRLEAAEIELRQYDEVKRSVRELEELVELCGKNGLPYRILGLILPLINAEISKILAGIVDFNVSFVDDPDDQSISLYIRYGDYRRRPLSLGSGAEKFIASLAIRVALLSVTSLPKTDFLVIDEGFGKLDQERLESLQRMLEYLKGAFGTVFIISHVDFMRDIVDHSIDIVSQNGYAHVEAE